MKTLLALSAVWLFLAAAAAAQMDMPKPGPEHKKLDYFSGSWTLDGDMKATPMGPAGKIAEKEKCDWMEGSFFLVCHTDFSGSMGSGTGISVLGYSAPDKTYTYREFNSWGEFDDSKGSVDGDTWTWTNDTPFKGKFTMKILSPTSYNFTYEMSQDGTSWTTVMNGTANKTK